MRERLAQPPARSCGRRVPPTHRRAPAIVAPTGSRFIQRRSDATQSRASTFSPSWNRRFVAQRHGAQRLPSSSISFACEHLRLRVHRLVAAIQRLEHHQPEVADGHRAGPHRIDAGQRCLRHEHQRACGRHRSNGRASVRCSAAPSSRLRRRIGFLRALPRSLAHVAGSAPISVAHLLLDRIEQAHREVTRHALRDKHHARGLIIAMASGRGTPAARTHVARHGSHAGWPGISSMSTSPFMRSSRAPQCSASACSSSVSASAGTGRSRCSTKLSMPSDVARDQRGLSVHDRRCCRRTTSAWRDFGVSPNARLGFSAPSRSRNATDGAATSVLLSSRWSASATCRRASGCRSSVASPCTVSTSVMTPANACRCATSRSVISACRIGAGSASPEVSISTRS